MNDTSTCGFLDKAPSECVTPKVSKSEYDETTIVRIIPYCNELLTPPFYVAESGVNISMQLSHTSCLIYFCYILSMCLYICMCIPPSPTGSIHDNDDNDSSREGETPDILLNNMRLKHLGRLIIGHLNINSIRNKFESLKQIIKNNLDILVVSETKLDHTFPDKQFSMDGYRTIRQDRKHNGHFGGGIIIFIREDIPCKELKFQPDKEIEGIFLEINLRKIKWLIMTGYNPKKENIPYFLEYFSQGIDKYICNYDNMLLIGDFNSEMFEKDMNEFCDLYNLKNLIREPTCYKNRNNPTCIDLMLTNREKHFQNSTTIESGLSDFHKMTIPGVQIRPGERRISPVQNANFTSILQITLCILRPKYFFSSIVPSSSC